ncbi:MAG: long-chain-fatty-acid--CoA ligase [Planctomycetes bacterium]|nr:long-chain-fatty-acid--CoA ligase [Planctomycetota bacterium]
MNLWTMLARANELHPKELAAVDGARRFDYATVHARAAALGAALQDRGVRVGERIAVLAANRVEFLELYFAAAAVGAILCPWNTRLAARELAGIAVDAETRVLFADVEFADLVRQALAFAPPIAVVVWIGGDGGRLDDVRTLVYDDALDSDGRALQVAAESDVVVAQLYYTSGTTGVPKGVMLTHRNVREHALAAIAELGLSDRDVWGHIAPMFHLADAWATFAITWVGGRHVFVPRFEEERVLDAIERERITITNLIPTMLNRLVKRDDVEHRDFSSFRRILSGGASIAPEVVHRVMQVFGCEYVQTYGMTETSPYLTLSLLKAPLALLPPDEQFRFRAKTGRAFLAVELDVVGDDGRPVARDGVAVGQIVVRGGTVTPGYWNRPEETRAAFRDGWLETGDLATIDAEGYVQIVDRKKDMINTGGEKVYSTEVEHVLYEHPAVLEAAVFGVPDPDWGEAVRAAVVLRGGRTADAEELRAFCRARLAGYKVPRRIDFLAELPRTGTGKITKVALRERVAAEERGTLDVRGAAQA